MAVQWGGWEYSGGNGMRVGVEINVEAIGHGETACTFTVEYWTENQYSMGDSQTMNFTGGWIGGSSGFSNNAGSSPVKRFTKTYTYNYGASSYGSSPGTRDFGCNISGAYNGVTPGVSDAKAIPARPYAAPAAPTAAAVNQGTGNDNKITWTRHETAGEPYNEQYIERYIYGYVTWDQLGGNIGEAVTSYTDTGTVENRKYTYRVRAHNTIGYSGYDQTGIIWTKPATPTSVGRADSGLNQVITWQNDNMGYSEYTNEVWHSADGAAFTLLATTAGETYTHTAPNPAQKHKYKVRTKTTSGDVLYSDYTAETSQSAGTLTAPSAPTQLQPSGDITADNTGPVTLSWKHNPTDGTAQTKYQIQHREAGTTPWNTIGPITSTASNHVLPANTYPADKRVEWQVMTWGASATAGSAWSTSAYWYTQASVPLKYPLFLDVATGQVEADSTRVPGALPYCHAYASGAQSIGNTGAAVAVALDSELYDTHGMHDPTTNNSRVTIKVAGRYRILATCSFAADGTGYRTVFIYINGGITAHTRVQAAPTTTHLQQCVYERDFAVGDYIEMWVGQTGTAARNTSPGVNYVHLIVTKSPTEEGSGSSGGGGGGGPTGPAGGDLSGSYPNPVIGSSKVTADKIAANTMSYTHVQGTPANPWVIDHPLSFRPNVTVVDSTGRQVEGDVVYTDVDTVTVGFSGAFSGTAYLS